MLRSIIKRNMVTLKTEEGLKKSRTIAQNLPRGYLRSRVQSEILRRAIEPDTLHRGGASGTFLVTRSRKCVKWTKVWRIHKMTVAYHRRPPEGCPERRRRPWIELVDQITSDDSKQANSIHSEQIAFKMINLSGNCRDLSFSTTNGLRRREMLSSADSDCLIDDLWSNEKSFYQQTCTVSHSLCA